MAKCKDCLHYQPCSDFSKIINAAVDVEKGCKHFEDRTKVEKVVRCKDCIYYHKGLKCGFGQCSKYNIMPYPDDFCSYGERRKKKGE